MARICFIFLFVLASSLMANGQIPEDLSMILETNSINTKGKKVIVESFENNRFGWDEYYDKNASTKILQNCMEMEVDDDHSSVTVTELPLFPDVPYTLLTVFDDPQISKTTSFGIVFNYEDNKNYYCFTISEGKAVIFKVKDATPIVVRTSDIILTSKKKGILSSIKKNQSKNQDKNVVVTMEYNGKNLIFSVDNMEIKRYTPPYINQTFGFIVNGEQNLKIKYLTLVQKYVE